MWISELRVRGYRAFSDTGSISFSPGLNLIVGQNNSGKSALISALGHSFVGTPHRNEEVYKDYELPTPQMFISLYHTGEDIRQTILSTRVPYFTPVPTMSTSLEQIAHDITTYGPRAINLTRRISENFRFSDNSILPIFGPNAQNFGIGVSGVDGQIIVTGMHVNIKENLFDLFHHLWINNTFHFNAQRYSIGSYIWSREDRLHANAGNLPAVLAALQGDRGDLFSKLVDHLSEIFDHIGNISVATTQAGFQVRTWPTRRMSAPELGFSLDDSGTGVSQVIAILLVVMTMSQSIIVIDEISSFLHPAAAKSLLRILQTNYSHHQYIITTHSPEIISSSVVSTMKLVRREGYASSVHSIDLTQVSELKDVCSHLGVTMSDVFAANRIIWVEGQTEEMIFPYIYSDICGTPPKGTVVTAVIATGDFAARRKRDREMAFSIYQRLTEVAAPLVEAAVFSFDQEGLSSDDMIGLQELSLRRILFLPRRNLEAFLLHPKAISGTINELLVGSEFRVTSGQVQAWLADNGGDRMYGANDVWDGDITNCEWLSKVDGAKIIKNIFSELSEARVDFSKTRDDIRIVRLILHDDRDFLAPLIDFVKRLYGEVKI